MRYIIVIARMPERAHLERRGGVGELVNGERILSMEGDGQGPGDDRSERGAVKEFRQREKMGKRDRNARYKLGLQQCVLEGEPIIHLRAPRQPSDRYKTVH